MKEQITKSDVYQLYSLDGLRYSLSGNKLIFSVKHADEFEDKFCKDIWLLDLEKKGKGAKQLTASGDIGEFIWESEDEILFESRRNNPKEGVTDFFKLSLLGAEAEKVFQISEKAKIIDKLSEGTYLVEIVKATDPKQADLDRAVEGKEFWSFTDHPFLHEGEPFGECRRKMLAIYHAKTEELFVITEKYFETVGYSLDEKKEKLLYYGETYFEHAKTGFHELAEYDIISRETKTLIPGGNFQISFAMYAGDEIIVQASELDHFKLQNHELYHFNRESMQLETIVESEAMCKEGALTQAGSIIGVRAVQAVDELVKIQLQTKESEVLGIFDECINIAAANNQIALIAMKETKLPEIYIIDQTEGSEECLTQFGTAYADRYDIAHPELISFTASNGETVEGIVMKPRDFDLNKTYPGILYIHDGPKGRATTAYMHQLQMLASEGMFVFYCNPHGSDGYGNTYLKPQGHLGNTDCEQCIEFTDAVLEKFPQIDPSRLGVTGIGYGGYLTSLIIAKTDRFCAAVTQDGFCHLTSECLISEVGDVLMESMFGEETPWTNEKIYWAQSPLNYAKEIKTPLFFIHGDHDHYCFWGEPMQLFTSLKQCGNDTKFLLFYGDGHGLSGIRKPSNMVKRAEALTDWFQKHF